MGMQTMKEVCLLTRKLTKERSNLSTITLNGLRAREDGVTSLNRLSHITVTKDMLSYVKDSHKTNMEHIETERKKELKKRCRNAELEEMKKKGRGSRKVEKLKSSMKDLDARESRAEQILQSASGFLEEGDKRMAKGLAENDMDEIEVSQKIMQLSHEKQKKAQDELQIVQQEKRKPTDKLGEQASKKVKYK